MPPPEVCFVFVIKTIGFAKNGGNIDLISMSLRKKLVGLEKGNADAVMPVLGGDGLCLMTAGRTLK